MRVYRPERRVRRRWKLALATGLLAFLIAVAAMTLPELVAGRSVVSAKHDTTIFGGQRHVSAITTKPRQKTTTEEQTVTTEKTPTNETETQQQTTTTAPEQPTAPAPQTQTQTAPQTQTQPAPTTTQPPAAQQQPAPTTP
jgi:outer membrane biosynthesis protein TonB